MSRSIFINLPVENVKAAGDFYTQMGFKLNQEFSNDQNAVIVIDEQISLMLVEADFFKQNAHADIADTSKVREVTLAIQVADHAEVDKLFDAGIAAGGKKSGETFEEEAIKMYSRGLTDLDGHKLDVMSMGA